MTEATSDIYQGETLYIYRCEDCGDSVTLKEPSNDPLCDRCEAALVESAREALDEAKAGGTMTLADFRAELEREEA
jgi:predicted nucleic acid-binding Zn ribbon protein